MLNQENKQNANLMPQKPNPGKTIFEAAREGDLETVKWWLNEGGATITEHDDEGNTALLLAARADLKMVQWLLNERGATITEKNDDGNTVLLCAAEWDNLTVVAWLLVEGGSTINEKNNNDKDALTLVREKWTKTYDLLTFLRPQSITELWLVFFEFLFKNPSPNLTQCLPLAEILAYNGTDKPKLMDSTLSLLFSLLNSPDTKVLGLTLFVIYKNNIQPFLNPEQRQFLDITAQQEQYYTETKFKPDNFESWILLGMSYYYERKHHEEVDKCCTEALMLKPDNYMPWALLGESYFAERKYEEAITCCFEALKLNPDNPKNFMSWDTLAKSYLLQKKYELAIECLDELITLKPDEFNYRNRKAWVLLRQKHYDETVKYCDEAIKLKPDEIHFWVGKGLAHLALKHFEETIKCCDEAIKLNPHETGNIFVKSFLHYVLKQYEEAVKFYKEALKLKPNEPSFLIGKALAHHALRQYEKTIKCHNELIKLKPDKPDYFDGLLKAYEKTISHNLDGVELELHRADYYWFVIGNSYEHLEKYEVAIKCYSKAIEFSPNNPTYWKAMGDAYEGIPQSESVSELKQNSKNSAETDFSVEQFFGGNEEEKKNELVPQTTAGNGDCPFHAMLGEWNGISKQFICRDVAKKRKKVADVIRTCKDTNPSIFSLVQEEIKAIVMENKKNIGDKNIRNTQAKYQAYEKGNNELIHAEWSKFEKILEANTVVMQYLDNFILEQKIELHSNSIKLKFDICFNHEKSCLLGILLSLPEIDNTYKTYLHKCSQGFDWDSIYTNEVIEGYAVFIETLGKWLLPLELNIIAIVFDLNLELIADFLRTTVKAEINVNNENKLPNKEVELNQFQNEAIKLPISVQKRFSPITTLTSQNEEHTDKLLCDPTASMEFKNNIASFLLAQKSTVTIIRQQECELVIRFTAMRNALINLIKFKLINAFKIELDRIDLAYNKHHVAMDLNEKELELKITTTNIHVMNTIGALLKDAGLEYWNKQQLAATSVFFKPTKEQVAVNINTQDTEVESQISCGIQ